MSKYTNYEIEDGFAIINDGGENLGRLIRTSIDMDDWISSEKAQLEGHQSGPIDHQDSDIPLYAADQHEIAEETSYSQLFGRWSSGCCEKEVCELGKCEMSMPLVQFDFSPAANTGKYDFNEVNCAQELQEQKHNCVQQLPEAGGQPSQEDIGNCITLEKTPEQTRYEDVMNRQLPIGSETVPNFHEANVFAESSMSAMTNEEISRPLPSFQDTFRKNWNHPLYLQAGNQCQVTTPRRTVECYKCHKIIGPQDWIRSITAGVDFTAVYHAHCFYCDYCKGVFCTDQYYTVHQGKLICNFDFQMLTNLRKVPDNNQKRLVVLHSAKKGMIKKRVRISLEQKKILQQALQSKNGETDIRKNP